MCGIAGYLGENKIAYKFLISSLKKLEYRGYDSAGVCVLTPKLLVNKVNGRVAKLQHEIEKYNNDYQIGIAHTRWATHGKPSILNAHPHCSNNEIAVVHNGIIENYQEIKNDLIKNGADFKSETDSEVICHLVSHNVQITDDYRQAIVDSLNQLDGAFAVAIIDQNYPQQLIVARNGSPLVIGRTGKNFFISSDIISLSENADEYYYLEEGEVAWISIDSIEISYITNKNLIKPLIPWQKLLINHCIPSKQDYAHFMLKEIHEQDKAIKMTYDGVFSDALVHLSAFGNIDKNILDNVKVIQIIACGTSYHAGLVAKHWIESITGKLCLVDIASEFRYRTIVIPKNTLIVAISQSGETADTLSALKFAKSKNVLMTFGICNVSTSSLVREVDGVFLTKAGIEIGVASTKAFSTQLVALYLMAIALQKEQQLEINMQLISNLQKAPALVKNILKNSHEKIKAIANKIYKSDNIIFLGRGLLFPIALEGALKLKEISYIHCDAYPAGELKHGPLALIHDKTPVIVIAPNDELQKKMKSNIREVLARGGRLIIICEDKSFLCEEDQSQLDFIELPNIPKSISPIIYNIPLQLLAYNVALLKGYDIDKPRNLAKSVTVE